MRWNNCRMKEMHESQYQKTEKSAYIIEFTSNEKTSKKAENQSV